MRTKAKIDSYPRSDSPHGRFPQTLLRYRWLIGLALAWLALDQATKALVAVSMPPGSKVTLEGVVLGDPVALIPGFLYLAHVFNTGAAWGLFSGQGYLLALFAILALTALVFFRRQFELHRTEMQVAFGLFSGGVVGNLIDRLVHGHVVDFIDVHLGFYDYPVFNFADIGIVLGTGLYLFFTFRNDIRSKKAESRPGWTRGVE